MVKLGAVFVALAGLCASPALACRLALLLALDVSGSVDRREYALQLSGLAQALDDIRVQAAFLADLDAPVALAIFEWSASEYQSNLIDWRMIRSTTDLSSVSQYLRSARRRAAPQSTGLGAALQFAERRFEAAPTCLRQVLDISADGQNNDFPPPYQVYDAGGLAGVTVNALAIRAPIAGLNRPEQGLDELVAYFRSKIIRGPFAFVERAQGYEDYVRAMTKKLLRELQGPPLGKQRSPAPYRIATGLRLENQ